MPFLILTYYVVIGGWVTKYMVTFLTGGGMASTDDSFFGSFISSTAEPLIYGAVFLLLTAFIIYRGVNSGIEKISGVRCPCC